MEIIRLILLEVESGEEPAALKEYPLDIVLYNTMLAQEAGLIIAFINKDSKNVPKGSAIERLTWEGHDFLDSTRDPKIWNKTKDSLLKTGVSWTFDVLKEVLKHEATKHFPAL